jgi:uncharacterized protein YgiM (DUF1202 family)
VKTKPKKTARVKTLQDWAKAAPNRTVSILFQGEFPQVAVEIRSERQLTSETISRWVKGVGETFEQAAENAWARLQSGRYEDL